MIRRLGILSLLLGVQGCGVRFGPVGLGLPVVQVDRHSDLGRPQWSPDSRYVIVCRTQRKRIGHSPMLIVPLPNLAYGMAHGGMLVGVRSRSAIYCVDVKRRRTRRIGDGGDFAVSPAGHLVAYGTRGGIKLADYRTGKRRRVTRDGRHFIFSPDGKWLRWGPYGGPWRVTDVRDTTRHWPVGEELADEPWARWQVHHTKWGDDGAFYAALKRGQDKGRGRRWVRFAPPAWELEDLGNRLNEAQHASIHAAERHPKPWESPDGTMVLRTRQKTWDLPDLLIFPGGEIKTENLDVVFPDGTRLKLTHFGPPWL